MCSDYIVNYIKVNFINMKKRKREIEDKESNIIVENKIGFVLIINL